MTEPDIDHAVKEILGARVVYSLRSRRLEVVGTRKNARARPFSLSPTTSNIPSVDLEVWS